MVAPAELSAYLELVDVRSRADLARTRAPEALVARAASRALLGWAARAIGLDPGRLGRRCPACGASDHGAPSVPDRTSSPDRTIILSPTRAPGIVALAVAPGEVGLDVVRLDAEVPLSRAVFSGRERDHLKGATRAGEAPWGWSIKEAIGKLDGTGLLGADGIALEDPTPPVPGDGRRGTALGSPAPQARGAWRAATGARGRQCWVRTEELLGCYAASIAMREAAPLVFRDAVAHGFPGSVVDARGIPSGVIDAQG